MKTKNIIITVLSAILVAIIAIVIALSCIPKNFNFGFKEPYKLQVSTSSTNMQYVEKSSEEYGKIMDLYKNSYLTSTINALFSGKAFSGKEFKEEPNSVSSIRSNGYCLVFNFAEKQTLNEETTYTKEYDTVYIQILDSTDFTQINAYMLNSENSYSYFKYTTYASQADLYNYLQEKFAQ